MAAVGPTGEQAGASYPPRSAEWATVLDQCKCVPWPLRFVHSVLEHVTVCKERNWPITKLFPQMFFLTLVSVLHSRLPTINNNTDLKRYTHHLSIAKLVFHLMKLLLLRDIGKKLYMSKLLQPFCTDVSHWSYDLRVADIFLTMG